MTLEQIDVIFEAMKRDMMSELQADMRSRFAVLDDVPTRVALLESEQHKRARHTWMRFIGEWWLLATLLVVGSMVGWLSPYFMQQFKEQVVMEVGQFTPRVHYPNPITVDRIVRQHVLEHYPTQESLERLFGVTTESNTRNPMGSRDAIFRTVPVLPMVRRGDLDAPGYRHVPGKAMDDGIDTGVPRFRTEPNTDATHSDQERN